MKLRPEAPAVYSTRMSYDEPVSQANQGSSKDNLSWRKSGLSMDTMRQATNDVKMRFLSLLKDRMQIQNNEYDDIFECQKEYIYRNFYLGVACCRNIDIISA